MENYIRIKGGVDDFYYEEFNILKSEIQKDIKVDIIDSSKFGDIGGRFNFLKHNHFFSIITIYIFAFISAAE